VAVWGEDEAGPFQTLPYPGATWRPEGCPSRQPHEYVRRGTAKLLTLFHPATGEVRAKGVTSCTNAVLHPWLKAELEAVVAQLPPAGDLPEADTRAAWERWQTGLRIKFTLSAHLPPLRLLLVLDNLIGHCNQHLILWLFAHGIMPLFTPLSGSWLNMTESVQRILKRRALDGQHPQTADEIIARLEAAARGWNAAPTPFVWGGKRQARRERADRRRHPLGGSGACTTRPIRRRPTLIEQWRSSGQVTH
jgi:DDE superfamily endonuclease